MSSATPLPTALAIVTFPARAAAISPGTPSVESRRNADGVEERVVDPAIDDVDALEPARGAHGHDVLVDDEVAALDELDAHLAGEERVLEVGGVEDAGREHDDASDRRRPPARRGAALRAATLRSGRPACTRWVPNTLGSTRVIAARFSST